MHDSRQSEDQLLNPRSVGASYLRAVVTGDTESIRHFRSIFCDGQLLTALTTQAIALVRRVAVAQGVTGVALCDALIAAANMLDQDGFDHLL